MGDNTTSLVCLLNRPVEHCGAGNNQTNIELDKRYAGRILIRHVEVYPTGMMPRKRINGEPLEREPFLPIESTVYCPDRLEDVMIISRRM